MMFKRILMLYMLLSIGYSQQYGWDNDSLFAANIIYLPPTGNVYVTIDTTSYLYNRAPAGIYGWSHNLTFTASDYNTVAWTSGTITFPGGVTYSIVSGNTGNITTPVWIYFDKAVSTTVLQTTSTPSSSVGSGRLVICVGEDNADSEKNATFQVLGGVGSGVTIFAENVVANTLTGNEILGNSLTIAEINFSTVPGDSVIAQINVGGGTLFIIADVINALASDDSGRRIVISPVDDRLYFYNAGGEVLRIGEDVLGTIDGIKVGDGMFYASTNSATQYSNLHIEKYGQSGAGIQGLQTLYLSNDGSPSVTLNPTNSWVVSKIEGERNSANDLYGIWLITSNAGLGVVTGARFSADAASGESIAIKGVGFSVNGTAIGATFSATSTNAVAYGIQATGTGSNAAVNIYGMRGEALGGNANNYGIYGTASGATQNYAGYFASGNVRIKNRLLFNKASSGLGKIEIEEGTTNAYGIWWHTDTNLYRSAANVLKTDDAFHVVGNIIAGGTVDGVDIATDVGANTTHKASTGVDHTYINQDLRSSASPNWVKVTAQTLYATLSLDIAERPSAPNHTAGKGKLWVQNTTSTPLRYTTGDDQDLHVVTANERTSLPATNWVGRVVIDTNASKIYMYADGGWREIATW